jgi:hypothetical protein
MATQLTISLELIAFMQWIIQQKEGAFSEFIDQALDETIRKRLVELQKDESISLSSEELYETLNGFLGVIEGHLELSLEQSRHLVSRQQPHSSKAKAPRKKCKHHKKHAKKREQDEEQTGQSLLPTSPQQPEAQA